MKILQVVPDDLYFIWQLYVQMLNFREYGVEEDAIILVGTSNPSPAIKTFEAWTSATVHYYPDTRESNSYRSSIRPNIIKQYLSEHPLPCFFYVDQDIIFLRKPDIAKFEADEVCYVAERAKTYIYAKYVDAFKKYSHLEDMGKIVGIDADWLRKIEETQGVGGGQYIIKNTDAEFWEKVERDCEAIYRKLHSDTLDDEIKKVYHIQIWTADMWALLYNLWVSLHATRTAAEIDFAFPWEEDKGQYTMHNAGIDESNSHLPGGVSQFFYKGAYRRKEPFADDFTFVDKKYLQRRYVDYFKLINFRMEPKRKILGVFCTNNKINSLLLQTVLQKLSLAVENTGSADVEIVTVSWQPIDDNPFESLVSPFRELGHLNYILQLKEALTTHQADIVCILEHDVLYPPHYFETVINEWDYCKYGLWNENYIGMNETGYQRVKERHHPMSMLSCAYGYICKQLDIKLNECVRRIHEHDGWEVRHGWVCVEPDNKEDFKKLPFTDRWPAIHVNMNHLGAYGTGKEGKNHHFTSHCEVCYESQGSEEDRNDWGDYAQLFPFTSELIGEVQ